MTGLTLDTGALIGFERNDHGTRVKPEDLGQVGAGDSPQFTVGSGLLLEIGECVSGPIYLDARDQVGA